MVAEVPVVVPHESVNDETVKLLRWLVEDGQQVSSGESVAEVEGSKSTFEVPSPQAGIIGRRAMVGEEIPIGSALCYVRVVEEVEQLLPSLNGIGPTTLPIPSPVPLPEQCRVHTQVSTSRATTQPETLLPRSSQRFSTAAQLLLRQHNMDPSLFRDLSLVRTADVRKRLDSPKATPEAMPPATIEKTLESSPSPPRKGDSPFDVVPLSRQKLTEIRYLREGGVNVIPSQVSTIVPTFGLRDALLKDPSALSLTSLIVFEAARLLRRHANLNSFYSEQSSCRYRDVNIGFAVAGEFGLKVPVVHNADQKTAGRIAEDIRTLLVAYASNSLSPQQLAGGTFTVSDLSGEGVLALNPLIVHRQAAILGVGAETQMAGDGERAFTLTLSFDHQLADGLEAARFLSELAMRLRHHEATLRLRVDQPTCSQCNRTAGEIRHLKGHLVQTLSESGGVVRVCSSCIAGF